MAGSEAMDASYVMSQIIIIANSTYNQYINYNTIYSKTKTFGIKSLPLLIASGDL